MSAALERRVLEAFDAALMWPEEERDARLAELERVDEALTARLRKLLDVERAAAASLPTIPAAAVETVEVPPPERISVYRLTALLGEGGMGTVWRGQRDDGLFDQAVAVKLMRPGLFAASAVAQFSAERRLLARLRHPNIAQIFDGGADPQGRAYFVMELADGVPLTEHVLARGSLEACLPCLEAICAAVHHAHQSLVVHADIKPSNILVDAEGRPKLLDFGISRSLDRADEDVLGQGLTQAYASPQRRNGDRAMPADDIYALGAVLHELALGAPPETAPPRPLNGAVAPELAAVVTKATAADPAARYDSPIALSQDLRRWVEGFPVQAVSPTRRRRLRLLVRRRPWVTTAVGAAAFGLVAAFATVSALYLRAETERRQADERFEQARGMAHYMLFDLFDRLSDAPGTLPLRRALADKARSYLDDLASAPRAPPSVRAEAAIGLMQIAGVDGLFSAGESGDRDRVEDLLRRAEFLLAGPADAERDPRLTYARGRLRLFQGFQSLDRGDGAAAAMPRLEEAVDLLERAAGLLPEDAGVATDLWQARLTLADAVGSGGDAAGEVEAVRHAVAAYAEHRPLLDSSEITPLLLARSFKLIGEAQMSGGTAPVAATAFARAEAVLVDEDAAHRRRSRTLMELADVRRDLADSFAAQAMPEPALAAVDASLAAVRERLSVEPEHEGLQRTASMLEGRRARLLSALARPSEALAAAAASLDARSRRHALRPADHVAWREYLSSLDGMAAVELTAGAKAEACGHLRAAKAGYDAYRATFPDQPALAPAEAAQQNERLAAC